MINDTIAAVASGMTASGIGIIRISGPEAFLVLSAVFRPRHQSDVTAWPANTIHYGHIVRRTDAGEEVLDECLVMVMRAPHTYTTEDTVEINTHGGPYVMQRVLELVLMNGARAAEPGEFTKRAFLGGRIDLTEAEAVMDVINARSDDALKTSLMQLSGSVRDAIRGVREILLTEMSYIEAALDDPEHYDLAGYGETLELHLETAEEKLRALSRSFGEGKMIREGILTVILGKPNAGKSSLLNALTGEDRAIVTDIEGTTRDILEEQVRLGGLMLRIIDTAGIRDARDEIEQIGIGRAREYAEKADLLLAIFDSARPLDENDREILSLIRGRRAVILLNKSDLAAACTPEMLLQEIRKNAAAEDGMTFAPGKKDAAGDDGMTSAPGKKDAAGVDGTAAVSVKNDAVVTDDRVPGSKEADMVVADDVLSVSGDSDFAAGSGRDSVSVKADSVPAILTISAKEREGLEQIESEIRKLFFSGSLRINEEAIITNARHRQLIDQALSCLDLVRNSIRDELPEDFYTIDLMDAYRNLGEIIGEEVGDDLADSIFSKFCMGK